MKFCYLMIASLLLAALSCPPLLAQERIPATIEQANEQLRERRVDLVRSWVRNYGYEAIKYRQEGKSSFGEWEEDGFAALRKMAAGMYVFTHPGLFHEQDWEILSGERGLSFEEHRARFREKAEEFCSTIEMYETIGTSGIPGKNGGDYDFILKEMVALIYRFKDHPEVLTNDMIWYLMTSQQEDIPAAGQDPEDYLDLEFNFIIAISMSETENHVLLIYTWRYLIQNYMEWVNGLPASHPRYDQRIVDLYQNNPKRYQNSEKLTDFMLQLMGRVVHNGLFETNGKPYASISTSAIQVLHSFADDLFPHDENRRKVRIAAQNALDMLVAQFAFQSLEGKRSVPMRRNWFYRKRAGLYSHDYMVNIFGILTGGYVLDDRTGIEFYPREVKAPNSPYWFSQIGQAGGYALWSTLLDYRVPAAIHDFMLHRYNGWWARIQSRYTKKHYPLYIDLFSVKPATPEYFNADKSNFSEGEFAPVTQFHFVTPDYLNSAGGYAEIYYPELFDGMVQDQQLQEVLQSQDRRSLENLLERIKNYHVVSKPFTIIPKGEFRFKPTQGNMPELLKDMESQIALMRGEEDAFFSSNNLGTYKNFSYGYHHSDPSPSSATWPQRYPQHWQAYLQQRFSIAEADFMIFDLRSAPSRDLQGHYLIMAKVSKDSSKEIFRDYLRGWWEVVPGNEFTSSQALRQYIVAHNPAEFFTPEEGKHYQYCLTTGEKLLLHARLGASDVKQPILAIWDAQGQKLPLERYYVDNRDKQSLRNIPLMSVWQVNGQYHFTGKWYAQADGKGRLEIKNPHIQRGLRIDSSDYSNPQRQEYRLLD